MQNKHLARKSKAGQGATIEQLQTRISKKEVALQREKERLHGVLNGIGFGYGMRAYSKLKNINFNKETKLENELKDLRALLVELKKQSLFFGV